jgi:hypothetical protein
MRSSTHHCIDRLEPRRLLTADFGFAGAIGGASGDGVSDVATDRAGNAYITGQFSGTADFDPSSATQKRTTSGASDAYVAKFNASGKLLWVRTIGGVGDDDGMSLAVDDNGNVLVGGFFNGKVDFDPGSGTTLFTSAGLSDGFMLKISTAGGFLWARQFAGPGDAGITEVKFDGSRNAYGVGMFTSSLDLDPSSLAKPAGNHGELDVCLVKLSPAGAFVYGSSFGGAGTDYANGIVIAPAGQVSIAGSYFGSVDFDPGAGLTQLSSAGSSDAYISTFDAQGKFLRVRSVGGSAADVCGDIAVDSAGGVIVVGGFTGNADFDPGAGNASLTSAGGMDAFILKLDSAGNYAWSRRIGGNGKDRATDIARDSSGSLYITGQFAGSVDFDPSTGVTKLASANGTQDAFVMKLSAIGAFNWARRLGGNSNSDIGEGIALGAGSDLLIGGRFRGTGDFDPGAGTYLLTSASRSFDDGFLSRLINR